MGWMKANRLKSQSDKTEMQLLMMMWLAMDMLFSPFQIGLHSLLRIQSLLELLLDPAIFMDVQVGAVLRNTIQQIGLVHQLELFLEKHDLAKSHILVVVVCLNYCRALCTDQNAASRLTSICCSGHISPVLRNLHFTSLLPGASQSTASALQNL